MSQGRWEELPDSNVGLIPGEEDREGWKPGWTCAQFSKVACWKSQHLPGRSPLCWACLLSHWLGTWPLQKQGDDFHRAATETISKLLLVITDLRGHSQAPVVASKHANMASLKYVSNLSPMFLLR